MSARKKDIHLVLYFALLNIKWMPSMRIHIVRLLVDGRQLEEIADKDQLDAAKGLLIALGMPGDLLQLLEKLLIQHADLVCERSAAFIMHLRM